MELTMGLREAAEILTRWHLDRHPEGVEATFLLHISLRNPVRACTVVGTMWHEKRARAYTDFIEGLSVPYIM